MSLKCNIGHLPYLFFIEPPFTSGNAASLGGTVVDAFNELLGICCADAAQVTYSYSQYFNVTSMLSAYRTTHHSMALALPVFTTDLALSLSSPEQYVKVLDLNAFVLIAPRPSHEDSGVGQSLISAWPVILLIWGCTGLVAYILWFIETYMSRSESPFRRTFGLGFLDGFWNSFITASTVGYGDSVVRSIVSRIVVVLWITLATMLFSVMTGTFTSVFTAINVAALEFPGIAENHVAVLSDSIESHLVLEAGGTPVTYPDISHVIDNVVAGNVALGLINAYTYAYQLQQSSGSSALLRGLREQVTNQFTAGVGFVLGNTYNSTLPASLYTCLQQESFISQLMTGQDSKQLTFIMEVLTQQERQTAAQAVTSQLFVPSEINAFIAVIASMAGLVLLTLLTFRLLEFIRRRNGQKRSTSADSTNQPSVSSSHTTTTNTTSVTHENITIERD